VVVAGINHGLNPGDDALYSGTVGAALEAALLSRPGVAVSQQPDDGRFLFRDRGPHTFEPGARLAARLVAAVAKRPPPPRTALNVNLPTAVGGEAGVVVARLGRRPEGVGRVVADDGDPDALFLYGTLEDPEPAYEQAPGTDFAALAAGRVTLTPISLNWGEPSHRRTLWSWAEVLSEALRPPTLEGAARER
jgi:5'-nucleotidase